MNIAVFGGSFDPPHLGHLHVALHLLKESYADEVWFMPVKTHAFGKALTDPLHRVAMLKLLTKEQPSIKVSDFELNQPGTSYTYQTLSLLRANYPQHSFKFVVGADNLPSFSKWFKYLQLLTEFQVLVYPRVGFLDKPLLNGMSMVKNITPIEISSTHIRQQLASGSSIAGLTDGLICAYIQQHHLYQPS